MVYFSQALDLGRKNIMLSYDYIPVNGHVVANVRGRKFLVDMGIPQTIARRPLVIEGQRLPVTTEGHGLKLQDFNHIVGIELDGVLGAQLSNEFVVNVLPNDKTLVLDHYQPEFPICIEVDNLSGMPFMHQSVDHKRVRGLINLGSALSWIQPELVDNHQSIGTAKELFGYIGEREVEVYSLPVMVDRQTIYLKFGAMPKPVGEWLQLANIDTILGAELLQHYAISMALSEGTVSMDTLH